MGSAGVLCVSVFQMFAIFGIANEFDGRLDINLRLYEYGYGTWDMGTSGNGNHGTTDKAFLGFGYVSGETFVAHSMVHPGVETKTPRKVSGVTCAFFGRGRGKAIAGCGCALL